MRDLFSTIKPVLHALDAETAHGLTIRALKSGFGPRVKHGADPILSQSLWGLNFRSPIGLAAGFDKNAEVIAPCLHMGFGFIETGTVTPRKQDGNPRPRIFRDKRSEAVINRMGFPNGGLLQFKENLEGFLHRRDRPAGIIGINIGMNKNQSDPAQDYTILIRKLGPLADYIAVNISSPNTPGLRDLQSRDVLMDLVRAMQDEREKSCGAPLPPLLLKLAPDLDEARQEELAQTVIDCKIDGLILTNTTIARPPGLDAVFSEQRGGLSGAPLMEISTRIIHNFYRLTGGKIPIIGAGGISSVQHAYRKIRAGASLVQLYTAMVYHGPALIDRITRDLHLMVRSDGFEHISQAVGADHAGTGYSAAQKQSKQA